MFFVFTPTWGSDPIWRIFFMWGWNHQLAGDDSALIVFDFRGIRHWFFCRGYGEKKKVPSRELTYPPDKAYLKMIFLFPRWDMLVPWRVSPSDLEPLHYDCISSVVDFVKSRTFFSVVESRVVEVVDIFWKKMFHENASFWIRSNADTTGIIEMMPPIFGERFEVDGNDWKGICADLLQERHITIKATSLSGTLSCLNPVIGWLWHAVPSFPTTCFMGFFSCLPRPQLTSFLGVDRLTFHFMGQIFQNMGHLGSRYGYSSHISSTFYQFTARNQHESRFFRQKSQNLTLHDFLLGFLRFR